MTKKWLSQRCWQFARSQAQPSATKNGKQFLAWHHDHNRNHHFLLMYDKDVAIAALLAVWTKEDCWHHNHDVVGGLSRKQFLARHHDHKRNHHFLMYNKDVAIAALLLEVVGC
jgi:hypothetical protein